MNELVNVWDAEYNTLSQALSFRVTCSPEVLKLVGEITRRDDLTPEEIALELGVLLERSIHLNLPRTHRFRPRQQD
tara:strand:- start:1166 stop:1393 length:228 start_codon:yes stop_codon:yes gene_type:complete